MRTQTAKRRTKSIYFDSILLYGFLQYTKQWHEENERIEDGTIYCTRNYICNALRWGYRKYAKAIKILDDLKLIRREQFPITDKVTGELKGSYTRIEIENS